MCMHAWCPVCDLVNRFKVALATRNHMECVSRLQQATGWHEVFRPTLARVRKSSLDQHKVRQTGRLTD